MLKQPPRQTSTSAFLPSHVMSCVGCSLPHFFYWDLAAASLPPPRCGFLELGCQPQRRHDVLHLPLLTRATTAGASSPSRRRLRRRRLPPGAGARAWQVDAHGFFFFVAWCRYLAWYRCKILLQRVVPIPRSSFSCTGKKQPRHIGMPITKLWTLPLIEAVMVSNSPWRHGHRS